MTASRDWSTYESKPADSDLESLGAGEIRNTKVDIRQRMAVDHVWDIDVTTDGQHNKLTLPAQVLDPANASGFGFLYSKDAGAGAIELYYEDAAGNKTKITNAGSLTVTAALAAVYPVGSIYVEVTGVNPATTFGFGTWAAFGAGRTMVGWATGDSDFGTVLQTGGEKTHTLTVAEMPAHTHNIKLYNNDAGSNFVPDGSGGKSFDMLTDSRGGDGAHNNIQPYIVVYFWRRTA